MLYGFEGDILEKVLGKFLSVMLLDVECIEWCNKLDLGIKKLFFFKFV